MAFIGSSISGSLEGAAALYMTGTVNLVNDAVSSGELRFLDDTDDGVHYVAIKGGNTTTSYTLTLPTAVAASSGYVLKSTDAGICSWAAEGGGMSFILEDDDGTEVSISNAEEVKFIGSGLTTNWTDEAPGSDGDPFDLTFTVDAAQTGITSLLATDIKIGEDDETKVDFETEDEIHFYAANAQEMVIQANVVAPGADDGTALGDADQRWSDLFLASGAVVNFDNGDITATHSANTLTVAGGTLACAAITGTTIDASTDFTIGTTVITDDSIVMTPSASDTVTIAAATHGVLSVTTVDAAGTAADINFTADGQIEYRANDAAGHIFDINGTNQVSIIDGAINPILDNDIDLGTAALRYKNIYTMDLNLNNDRGNWTVVEEEDMLTIRNNHTGKWYKMNMTEIDSTGRDEGMATPPV